MPSTAFRDNQVLYDNFDVFCFCHLRWDFVTQRPQHLMGRFGKQRRVFMIEEPVFHDGPPILDISTRSEGIFICVPTVPHKFSSGEIADFMTHELERLIEQQNIDKYIAWFYTPMLLPWARLLKPQAVIYDCMDELSGFKNAPPELMDREKELFAKADLVFTGGHSLYQAKKQQHANVHAFPSSIDKDHFAAAIGIRQEMGVKHPAVHPVHRPQIGFVGVIDERLDIPLLGAIADLRPEWDFTMVGPVVKIDRNDLPKNENIHYLGQKAYDDLPDIMAGWDVAMMPFALNESTRFISPTKTPEYLAAGLPVVSTPIADVVRPYGEMGLVSIASNAEEFVDSIRRALNADHKEREGLVSEFLANMSWDKTFRSMSELIRGEVRENDAQLSAVAGQNHLR